MKVLILYECRFGVRHSQEEITALKALQAAKVLLAAGCRVKGIILKEESK